MLDKSDKPDKRDARKIIPKTAAELTVPKADSHLAPTLSDDVAIELSQGGVAGISGTRIRLKRDGSWSASKILGSKETSAFMTGQLSSEEISAVAAIIEGRKGGRAFSELAPPLPIPRLNGARTSVRVGDVNKSVYLGIKTPRDSERSESLALVRIAQDIMEVLGVSAK